MGKQWDGGDIAFRVELWAEVLRVLKPGGHLIAFSGTRTYHRMACAIEDAGFEIRDQIGWAYGSGFPKSHDVSKGIDKAAGVERDHKGVGRRSTLNAMGDGLKNRCPNCGKPFFSGNPCQCPKPQAITEKAKQWQGWGTALKPAVEYVCVAKKPLSNEQHIHAIKSKLQQLWFRLWLMLPANVAENYSGSNQNALDEALGFAQWTAEEKSNIQVALLEQMDMSQLESMIHSSLNTVLSWKNILEEISIPANMSIIETELNQTIDWKTLSFLSSKITLDTIIKAHKNGQWSNVNASNVERAFNASVHKLNNTLELSVLGNAISQDVESSLDVDPNIKLSPICLARKPLIGTVAQNVLEHGTGAINIDGCRVSTYGENITAGLSDPANRKGVVGSDLGFSNANKEKFQTAQKESLERTNTLGRWPANIIHDGSEEVLAVFPDSSSKGHYPARQSTHDATSFTVARGCISPERIMVDSGSAARFFYCAKASKKERGEGNNHPTVKPISLMQYLCRLVTPPNGTVLDPFMGSGTTGIAATKEGFDFIGIEKEKEYFDIAVVRIGASKKETNETLETLMRE